MRVLVAHGQIGTHRSAGRPEGELAAADEVESANASLSVGEALPTAFGRLHHGRDRLRGILCTLAALSCSRKGMYRRFNTPRIVAESSPEAK